MQTITLKFIVESEGDDATMAEEMISNALENDLNSLVLFSYEYRKSTKAEEKHYKKDRE